jgi:glycosyltransferase involved in cell wall biosynthesis
MNQSKVVSVAIPTRNRLQYLQKAIESAFAADYPHIEILVSDNASTDETPAIADIYRNRGVRWYRQESDLGMVGNWNFCLRVAKGDYFLLLSDDDELTPPSLNLLARAIECNSASRGVACSYGSVEVISSTGERITKGHHGRPVEPLEEFIAGWLQSRRSIFPCSTLLRRADMLRVGGYKEQYGPFADVGAWLDVACLRPDSVVAFVDEPLARYRMHESNLSGAECITEHVTQFDLLSSDFSSLFSLQRQENVTRYRAALVASKLRVMAKRRRGLQGFQYLRLIHSNWSLIGKGFALEPYFRNLLILSSPMLYEVYKRRLSSQVGREQ